LLYRSANRLEVSSLIVDEEHVRGQGGGSDHSVRSPSGEALLAGLHELVCPLRRARRLAKQCANFRCNTGYSLIDRPHDAKVSKVIQPGALHLLKLRNARRIPGQKSIASHSFENRDGGYLNRMALQIPYPPILGGGLPLSCEPTLRAGIKQ
jgi:hypothetical protein